MSKRKRRLDGTIRTAAAAGARELRLVAEQDDERLTLLPDSLRSQTQLETLTVARQALTGLPDWIGELENLESLDVSGNKLTTLPAAMSRLRKLQSLNLDDNSLGVVPAVIRELPALKYLHIWSNGLTTLPEWIGELAQLKELRITGNQIAALPESIGNLVNLTIVNAQDNRLTSLPPSLARLPRLERLILGWAAGTNPEHPGNPLRELPEWVAGITSLTEIYLNDCQLTDVPAALADLPQLQTLTLDKNPLNPELAAAYREGLAAVKRYLKARRAAQVELNEAKLIVIGEGEVGKSSLLCALRDEPWVEGRPTTHGIEIRPVHVQNAESGAALTLNGWDFGGQRVYRPTHQLFFSAPAVYLVVWKPREGSQQGLVREWIKLVKHREPEAVIIVVATHGGPTERQPDIDRQELWDLFGRDMIVDFVSVESRPDPVDGSRKGVDDLRRLLARVAAALPEVGRKVPKRWEQARQSLASDAAAYLPLEDVLARCGTFKMDEDEARDFVRVSHRLGYLIHYEHDPALRDVVVLKPDWLAAAISFVLDDKETRDNHGLVSFARLASLWDDSARPSDSRYAPALHPLFLRLMERFDLSYKVAIPSEPESAIGFWHRVGGAVSKGSYSGGAVGGLRYTSLIAQLVPDIRPDPIDGWLPQAAHGDLEQSQICRIVEIRSGQTAAAEGLFYQLIVRLHKYSLGRVNHAESVHWQRGLVLEDDYGARALLEHAGNDVRITVRSPYPERFLAALTYEVKWLVENFWAGLRCDVMVPCLNPVGCSGLFDVSKLIENKKRQRPEQPCPVCNEWQDIQVLLHNAPAARSNPLEELLANSTSVLKTLSAVRVQLEDQHVETRGRFDRLDTTSRELLTKVDAAFTGLMRTLVDEARDGPRLFSFEPVDPGFFDRPRWISEKFRFTLWCEHSRLPLPALNRRGDERGVYELSMPRDWVVSAAPFLKLLVGTLALVVPVASSAAKLVIDDAVYKGIEKQLDLGEKSVDSLLEGAEQVGGWIATGDGPELQDQGAMRAQGAVLRQVHAWLQEKDPSFGGLVRVQNKRQEFLWVHPQFEKEY
jgi:GTPase SAR1 family protein